MRLTTTLKQLGFSPLQAKIYSLLLKHAGLSVTELARLTGKHRPAVYRALPALIEGGLVSTGRRGQRPIYQAESPLLLSSLIKERQSQLELALPTYLNTFLNRTTKPKISFYEGKAGIQTVYEYLVQSTSKGDIIYRYESPLDYSRNKQYYPSLYWQRASSRGDLEKMVITNEETNSRRHDSINRLSKAVPLNFDPFNYNITQLIVADKVAFIDYTTETAILIEHPRFADFQRKLFTLFFKKL